jgi:hypothetical protein
LRSDFQDWLFSKAATIDENERHVHKIHENGRLSIKNVGRREDETFEDAKDAALGQNAFVSYCIRLPQKAYGQGELMELTS